MTVRTWQLRIEEALSSRRAVATAVVVAFIALGLAVYVEVRQINLTNCLAAFNDDSAKSTSARARIAAEDRLVDEADRRAVATNEEALDRLLLTLASGGTQAERRQSFAELIRVRRATAEQRIRNEETRKRNEAERKRNPVPAPPSQRCG